MMKKRFFRYSILGLFLLGALILIFSGIYYWKQSNLPRTSGAYKALNFWSRSRAYPNPTIAGKQYYQAFEQTRAMAKKQPATLQSASSWETMGPLNVPGRMISVAVNPQNSKTLYAGSASGGLWRTFNAEIGANWHRIPTGFPVLGVMAVAIDPADSNVIYIGTGEVYGYQRSVGSIAIRTTRGSYGIGILKSTDAGRTWSKSLDWTYHQERGVQALRINPQNHQSIFAATSEGIYKSVDAGTSWKMVLPVFMGEDIVIHAADTNKVMVSCGNLGSPGSGFYRSLDGGKTWRKLTGIPQFTGKSLLEPYGDNPDWVFASIADSLQGIGLYMTEDFGETWFIRHIQDVPRYQGFFSHWVAVHPKDFLQVVHAGVNIYKSNNSGFSIRGISGPQPHVDHHAYAHDPNHPGVLYIACDGGVYRSTDFGESYTDIGYGLQTAQFYNGFSSSWQDPDLAMGGLQDNNTVIYNGTPFWRRVIGGDGCWSAINTKNDNILYGEYQYNNIRKSTNRGRNFSGATNGMYGNAAFVAPYVLAPTQPEIMYSGRKLVFKSTDGAETWFATNGGKNLDNNVAISMAIAPTNHDIVYVGTAPLVNRAHIFRTIDGGETWKDVTRNLPDRYPMDIAVDPLNEQTVYVVFAGFGSGHVYKSINGGAFWLNMTHNLPDIPTLSIAIDPMNSNHVYIGNDLGVYVSTNGGYRWTSFDEGLPEAVIAMDLNIAPPNRKIRVATHGNGAYQRDLMFKTASRLALRFDELPSLTLVENELPLTITVVNQGGETQTESLQVKLRILNPNLSEIFSQTKSICCLAPQERRKIDFEQAFAPTDTGTHFIELIKLDASVNDTTRQELKVILPPSIARYFVTKKYLPYAALTTSEGQLTGDDAMKIVPLPFLFNYDDFDYNQVQICTNGWVELGRGRIGSERGLSTREQIGDIGANENGRLAAIDRPSKVLGPWWENLNTTTSGNVCWATIGSAPTQIFVVEWHNVLAYFDDRTTSTRINFQVRFFEASQHFEYHYGLVTAGTFQGTDIGAMIGFKDHIGGDYHYYDIPNGGIEPASQIVTDLSPLTNWPGPDSVYVIEKLDAAISAAEPQLPRELTLYQNYPNPFNPSTTIYYYLPQPADVQLIVYNSLGQVVKTLVDNRKLAGYQLIEWDGRDEQGSAVSSGLYVYRLQVGLKIEMKKMMYLK